jgi:hypothetical protein
MVIRRPIFPILVAHPKTVHKGGKTIMKKRYLWLGVILIVILLLGLYVKKGTHTKSTQDTEESQSTELTEQQRQILEKEGVPADYEQMTDQQKRYLERADLIMTYLYDKYHEYGVNFIYDGYHAPEMFDGEWLGAYPEGGDPELDRVIVERKKGSEDIFEDDYLDVAIRPYCTEILEESLSQWFDLKYCKVYVRSIGLENMDAKDLPNLNKEFLKDGGALYGVAYVYISEEVCNQAEFAKFASEYHAWLQKNQYYVNQHEYLYTQEGIEQLTAYNFADNRDKFTICKASGVIEKDYIIEDGVVGEEK